MTRLSSFQKASKWYPFFVVDLLLPPSLPVLQGEPIIYASMNYRLNSYGFLASDELAVAQKDGTGTLNAGLHDIQSALLWIQKYVDKFGGDPTKVYSLGVFVTYGIYTQAYCFRSQVF